MKRPLLYLSNQDGVSLSRCTISHGLRPRLSTWGIPRNSNIPLLDITASFARESIIRDKNLIKEKAVYG